MNTPKLKDYKYLDYYEVKEYFKEKYNIDFNKQDGFQDWLYDCCVFGDIFTLYELGDDEIEEYEKEIVDVHNLIFTDFADCKGKYGIEFTTKGN